VNKPDLLLYLAKNREWRQKLSYFAGAGGFISEILTKGRKGPALSYKDAMTPIGANHQSEEKKRANCQRKTEVRGVSQNRRREDMSLMCAILVKVTETDDER
jgi:hypothetical protein